jgi:endonuclease/exonuclease/phosphatase family metal-dependent hydrolase
MNLWRIIGLFVFIPLSYVIGCIVYAKLTYFSPDTIEVLYENTLAPKITQKSFSAMIWNIGYCGLGEKSDFFYDGGKMMRPSEEDMQTYFDGMMNQLRMDTVDFQLLQEVDSNSKRSYYLDQVSFVRAQSHATNPYGHFAFNYKVNYIPMPWLEPMGKVNSGLLSLSKYEPFRVERHQLPGAFGLPKQLFFLRRCLLVQYFHLDMRKDLVMINLHNSAYDEDGKLKKEEMNYLKKLLTEQSKLGNYILCGGDWNQCPPDFSYDQLAKGKQDDYSQTNVEKTLIPNGAWAYDGTTATNRKNNLPYTKDRTFTTVIDFFWHSDNIYVSEVKGISNDFRYSDHQPVLLKFELNESREKN